MAVETTSCRCDFCAQVHADFIAHFGKWPEQTHADAVAIQDRRNSNEASWKDRR